MYLAQALRPAAPDHRFVDQSINPQTVKLQTAKPLSKLAVVGNDQSTFRTGDIFNGVKRENCRTASTDMTALIQRPHGMGRIFYYRDAITLANGINRVKVGGAPA